MRSVVSPCIQDECVTIIGKRQRGRGRLQEYLREEAPRTRLRRGPADGGRPQRSGLHVTTVSACSQCITSPPTINLRAFFNIYFSRGKEDFLRDLTRDNTQLLINKIWELPTERVDEAIIAKLPLSNYALPRAKPVPTPKPLTKWQQFALDKGIKKTKQSKLSWDEQLQKWIPKYGYKRAAAEKDKDWVLEVPQNADPYEDQFAKKAMAKSEKVAKNELQRLRNIAKAKNIKVPKTGLLNPDVSSAKEVSYLLIKYL